MRSILAMILTLSLGSVAFAQDNTTPATAQSHNKATYGTTTTLSQLDLKAVFQADSKVNQQNVLSQQESYNTVGGTTCYTYVGTDGTAYQICY